MLAGPVSKNENTHRNLSYTFAKSNGVFISDLENDLLTVVYRPDCAPEALIELGRYYALPLRLVEVDAESFTNLLTKKYEKSALGSSQIVQGLGENIDFVELLGNIPASSDILENEKGGAPVILLINSLLREAIRKQASDLHFETFEKTLAVRLRIDGVLCSFLEIPYQLAPLVISRIKIMAKLDISEKRLPQDGRMTVKIAERSVDIRVSSIPTSHGERIVLRLLDKKSANLKLKELLSDEAALKSMQRIISKPHGMMLVTGPTGSGKTTTLYAMLSELNIGGCNIMTVEDPIEYDLAGVSQMQVNSKLKLDFARSLRAILRQDPNVIMIGEIRDLETATIAIQASLTGHLVFSTLHTNTAIGAITRLRDIGIESFLLSACLIGIIAQRLIRLLCPACKEPYSPSPQDTQLLKLPPGATTLIYRPRGCNLCDQTGYRGRTGIYEIIEIDARIRGMIHENESEEKIEAYVRTLMPSIWQDSCQRVLSGLTSLEEIVRVAK